MLIIFVFILLVPFAINEAYKYGNESDKGYYTLWEAKDVLIFYGSFLAFLGTVFLGAIALLQNKMILEIQKTQIKAECYSRLKLHRFEIFDCNSDKNDSLFSQNILKPEKKTFCFQFESVGKSIPYKINITCLKLFVNEENNITFYSNQDKRINNISHYIEFDDESTLATNINLEFENNGLNKILCQKKLTIFINLEYYNNFDVLTTGRYAAVCFQCETPYDNVYNCKTFSCSNEKYQIIENSKRRQ